MNIAHVTWSMNCGGTENLLLDELRHFPRGHSQHLFVVNQGANSLLDFLPNDVGVHCLGRVPGTNIIASLVTLAKFRVALARLRPDVIVCHQPSIVKLLPQCKLPIVARIHNTYTPVGPYANSFARVVAISNGVGKHIKDECPGISVDVVFNGICIEDYVCRTNWTVDGPLRFLQIGRLDHRIKGQDISLHAFKACIDEYGQDLYLDFIGDGPSREFLANLSHKLGLGERINFLGEKSRRYIKSHLCNYEALLQPSLSEGFGLTIVEAMAAKVPVIVSNIEGPTEIVSNGRFGLLFKCGDVDDCVKSINSLTALYGTGAVREKVEAGWEDSSNRYDIRNMTAKLEEIYKDSVRR